MGPVQFHPNPLGSIPDASWEHAQNNVTAASAGELRYAEDDPSGRRLGDLIRRTIQKRVEAGIDRQYELASLRTPEGKERLRRSNSTDYDNEDKLTQSVAELLDIEAQSEFVRYFGKDAKRIVTIGIGNERQDAALYAAVHSLCKQEAYEICRKASVEQNADAFYYPLSSHTPTEVKERLEERQEHRAKPEITAEPISLPVQKSLALRPSPQKLLREKNGWLWQASLEDAQAIVAKLPQDQLPKSPEGRTKLIEACALGIHGIIESEFVWRNELNRQFPASPYRHRWNQLTSPSYRQEVRDALGTVQGCTAFYIKMLTRDLRNALGTEPITYISTDTAQPKTVPIDQKCLRDCIMTASFYVQLLGVSDFQDRDIVPESDYYVPPPAIKKRLKQRANELPLPKENSAKKVETESNHFTFDSPHSETETPKSWSRQIVDESGPQNAQGRWHL